MEPLRFYFHQAELHDRCVGAAGDFEKQVERLVETRGPALVQVAPTNFHRLDQILAGLYKLLELPFPEGVTAFAPIPLKGAADRYLDHLKDLSARFWEGPFSIEDPGDAERILRTLEDGLGDHTENELLRVLGILAEDVFIGPEVFHLDLSNACNLSCVYCGFNSPLCNFTWKTDDWVEQKIDWDLFVRVADELAEMRAFEHIAVCGEGEPTTHPLLMKMLAYLKEKQLGVALYSNSLDLSPERMEALVELGIDFLICTISAADAATYVALHPTMEEADYERLIANLGHLLTTRKKLDSPRPHLTAKHVITTHNAGQLPAMAEQAVELGADILMFELMHATGAETQDLVCTAEQLRALPDAIAEAKRICDAAGIEMTDHLSVQLENVDEATTHWSDQLYDGRGCFAGWFFGRLYTDKKVSFCCQGKVLGELTDSGFKDLWFSDTYAGIRSKAKDFDPKQNHDFIEGGKLIAPGCARCGNYYTNQAYYNRIVSLGLDCYLNRPR
jgi:MoaA/NifB/PqqE/SkfB family radical SAM enzyme